MFVSNGSQSTTRRLSCRLGAAAAALLAATLAVGCGGGTDSTDYDVTVSVLTSTDLHSIHLNLQSFFNDGDFIGHGEDVDCVPLVNAVMTTRHYGDGSIDIWLEATTSFAVPAAVVRCGLRTAETMRDTSLNVDVIDATDFTFSPTDATATISSVVPRS